MDQIYSKGKVVAYRFLRGAVAGAVASMVGLQVVGVQSFSDLQAFAISLTISGIMGGVTGGLLALDKYFRA